MGIFGRRSSADHSVEVVYVYEPANRKDAYPPYYSALCTCGWNADVVEAQYPDRSCEERVIAAALEHDPAADTSVSFPLDRPPTA